MNELIIPGCLAKLGFVYHCEVVAPDGRVLSEIVQKNLIPQVGMDLLAGFIRGQGALVSNWYVGVYAGNFVPSSATAAADLPTNAGEATNYSQATRPLWDNAYDGTSVIGNLASRAEFTFAADTRLYGGFLVSSSAKGGNTGTLLSIARFATPQDVPAGSTFRVGVTITLLSTY
jgi:hypothetical protein